MMRVTKLITGRSRCFFSRPLSLREVFATIFALSAALPLLVFVFLLVRYRLLGETVVQGGLLVALGIALLGFVLSQRVINQVSYLAQELGAPTEQAAKPLRTEALTVPGLGPVTEVGQLAAALNRMLEDLRASTERLEDLVFKLGTLNEMVEVAAKIPTIQELLGLVLERTMRTVRATLGSVMLLDEERQTLRIAAARGLPDEALAVEIRVGDGIAGKVVQLGEPVLVEDIETDPRFAKASDPRYGSKSFISLPVRVRDRIIGVVNLAKKASAVGADSRPFSSTDLQFLNALITYIAYALDNARLLEEARQSAQRLQQVVQDQELRLTVAQQQMLRAEKLSAMGQLLAGVAHELNNPLSVVMGRVSLLRQRIAGTPLAEQVEKIAQAAERCARIVKNFLALARQRPPERAEVRLNQITQEAVELLAYPLRVDNVEVQLDLAEDLPVLWADRHQLSQVVVNLVTNAHQAMRETPPPRRLTLATRYDSEQGWVSLEAADTGPGIPPELQRRIFEPFFTTKPSGQGTGLGLSLCQGIIEGHRGAIRVESAPGQGAMFRIELPVVAPPVSMPEAQTGESPAPLRGNVILVVDDEPEIAALLAEMLSADGHEVETAANGVMALERLRKRAYDLIVSDIKMPELDGPGLYRELERCHPGLLRRIIFLTGDTLGPQTAEFLEQTGAPMLSKPLVLEEVWRAVRRALRAPTGGNDP